MHRHIERELMRARLASDEAAPAIGVRAEAERMIAAMRKLPRGAALEWELGVSPACEMRIDPADLTELLGNVLDNARKWARSKVRILDASRDRRAEIRVEDDGPGVTESLLDEIRARGRKLDETTQGAGLGLAIVDDIADRYGLTLETKRSDLGGLQVSIGFAKPMR